MALQTSGPIKSSEIQDEFGGTNPVRLSEYYGADTGVPTSGRIRHSDFYGTSDTPPVVQTTLTISETFKNGYGDKLFAGAYYGYKGYKDIVGTTGAMGGNISPKTFLGAGIGDCYLGVDGTSRSAGTFGFAFNLFDPSASHTATLNRIVRILPQGGSQWLYPYQQAIANNEYHNGNGQSGSNTWYIINTGWVTADGSAFKDIPRWNGSGTSTLTIEYTL